MKEWFFGLETRERVLVATAAVLSIIALIFIVGVRPLLSGADRAERRVADNAALLAELEALAARLGPGGGAGNVDSGVDTGNQSLVVLIDRTTRAAGLGTHVKRNQPDGAASIRVRLEEAPFDNLVKWLVELKSNHGLTIASANIDRAQRQGRVNCNLLLTR